MKRLISAVLFVVAGSANSETVVVRSGEHDNFSRLVITLDSPSPWRFGRSKDGYTLELTREDVTLDVSDVFRLIPRTRLAALAYDAQDHQLELNVGCDCHATAFAPNGLSVAIDILDGPAPIESAFEKPLEAVGPEPDLSTVDDTSNAEQPLPVVGHQVDRIANDSTLRFFWRNQQTSMLEAERKADTGMRDGPEPGSIPVAEASPDLIGLTSSDIKSDLLEQLGRAATQGLVVPVQDRLLSATDIASETTAVPLPFSEPAGVDALPPAPQFRIRTDTSIDRDTGNSSPPNETRGGKSCLPDDMLDLNSWGDAKDAASQIGTMNRALVGEFDVPDPLAVNALVHYYLMLGWGAEAAAVMQEFPSERPEEPLLRSLAEILDHGSSSGSALAGMESCPGNAALWSVLSNPALGKGTDVNRPAVLGAFSRLPLHLRRHLLPELAERFLGIEDRDTAQALRDIVTRAGGNHGIPLTFVEAEIDLDNGFTDEAAAQLAEVVAADNEMSPDALVKLIDLRVGNGETIDTQTVAAVDALAYEHRGTTLGGRLSRAHVQAAAANGALDDAFAAWQRLDPENLPEADSHRIANAVGRGMISEQDDATFLRLVFAHGGMLSATDLPAGLRIKIAERLLTLTFPDEAMEFLLGGPGQPSDLTALHLLARCYQMKGDISAAIEILDGQYDEASQKLHAEMLSALGDNRAAAELMAHVGDKDMKAKFDWRAGDWAAVSTQDQSTRSEASALLSTAGHTTSSGSSAVLPGAIPQSDQSVDAAPPGPLAKAAAMVEESRQARDTLRALLAEPALTPDSAGL